MGVRCSTLQVNGEVEDPKELRAARVTQKRKQEGEEVVKEEVKEEVKLGPGEHRMDDGHVHNPPPGRDAEADPSV